MAKFCARAKIFQDPTTNPRHTPRPQPTTYYELPRATKSYHELLRANTCYYDFSPYELLRQKSWMETGHYGCTVEDWEWMSKFHATLYIGCHYLFVLGLQLNNVNKMGSGCFVPHFGNKFAKCKFVAHYWNDDPGLYNFEHKLNSKKPYNQGIGVRLGAITTGVSKWIVFPGASVNSLRPSDAYMRR